MRGGTARQCPSALFTSPPPVSAVLTLQMFGELHQKALWEVAQTKGSQTTSSWPSATEFGEEWHMATSTVSKDETGFLGYFTLCLLLHLPSKAVLEWQLVMMLQKRFLRSPVLTLQSETGNGCKLQCFSRCAAPGFFQLKWTSWKRALTLKSNLKNVEPQVSGWLWKQGHMLFILHEG